MAKYTINCQDCGAHRETNRSNTKYCEVCRTFRDLVYVQHVYGDKETRKCMVCETAFAPLHGNDGLCGNCAIDGGTTNGTCSYCGTENTRLLRRHVAVCLVCARDPKQRKTFLKSLIQKRKERLDTQYPPAPNPPRRKNEPAPEPVDI